MSDIRVLLADDEITILQGIRELYNWKENGFEIINTAMDGITALNLTMELKPDLLIIDINMPLMSGLEVVSQVKEYLPDTMVMIMSGYSDAHYMRQAIQCQVFDYILKPVMTDDLQKTLQRAKLQLMNRSCHSEQVKEEPEKTQTVSQQMVAYLNEHISEDISLQTLAEVFHLNPSYVSQYFKKETGMNYSTYLSELRMQKAKKLLRMTDLSITQIAEQAGFHDYRLFSRTFKQAAGVTPSQYRLGNDA